MLDFYLISKLDGDAKLNAYKQRFIDGTLIRYIDIAPCLPNIYRFRSATRTRVVLKGI
jgi:hypothetical protein